MDETLLERITSNPDVMTGKPVVRGTRIPVEMIVRMRAQDISEADILQEYPSLQPDDIRAALAYAAETQRQHHEALDSIQRRRFKPGKDTSSTSDLLKEDRRR
jgi:uncharacterized protein (DUF433 family)